MTLQGRQYSDVLRSTHKLKSILAQRAGTLSTPHLVEWAPLNSKADISDQFTCSATCIRAQIVEG
jgi:hypothetical protein